MNKSSIIISDSQPLSIATGDFNNDNWTDFVVANSGADTIGIFISYDNGTYADQQTYPTGLQSRPCSIVVNDFNNDNYSDIVVANYGTNSIGIFLGYGNGTFTNQKTFSTDSSHPLFITVADFNNDNRSDIAVANNGTNTVGIFLGYGDGSFQVQRMYFTDYDSLPHCLAVGDVDNDNHLDIAIANYGTNNIGILLGYGNGSFKDQQTYTTGAGSNPSSVAFGDFNNDNRLDIVVADFGIGKIGMFLGHGNGSFAHQKTYSLGLDARPQYITVDYFDENNKSDVVIVDSANDRIHILLGSDDGTFATLTTYDATSGSRPSSVAVADLDKDNQLDIVVVNYDTNNVLVLTGYFIYPSVRQTNYFFGYEPHPGFVAVVDINNDGHVDMVTGGVKDGLAILIGYGNGTFVRERTYSTGNQSRPQVVCIIDLNNDNQIDIVSANEGSDSVGVLLGQGNGTLADVTTYSTGIGSGPRSVAVGDMNNDNQLDIVSANYYTESIGVLLAYGNGSFADVTIYSTGSGSDPISVAVGDVNNDNQLDIVVAVKLSHVVTVLLGHSNGTFQSPLDFSTGDFSLPLFVTLSDLNNDNQLDIVVANSGSFFTGIRIFLGDGNGSFRTQRIRATGYTSSPYSVVIADFNNDEQSDIAVTLFGFDAIAIFYGYGNGTFELARMYSTGSSSKPTGIAAADFNNDKQLEIVAALWGTENVAVLTEYNAAEFTNQTIYSTGSAPRPYSIAVGDFNNDNKSDIIVANSGTDNVDILLGLGNGSFRKPMIYPMIAGSHPQYVITVDINNDDQLDFITVNSKIDSVSIFNGYGNGTFVESTIFSFSDNTRPYAIAVGDFNNDNRPDLVTANEGTDSISIFFEFDYALFAGQKIYSNVDNLGPASIIVNDLNNDTYPDIVVGFLLIDNIAVLLGYGNGSFGVMQSYSIGNSSTAAGLAVGDVNNDGRLDIIVPTSGDCTIVIFFGYGNGSFTSMMTISTGNGSLPHGIAVADFNHDSKLDIAVTNVGIDNVGILLGHGNGSFADMVTYSTGDSSYPSAITVSDFNNDDRLDIAVLNSDAWNVGILLGYGDGSFAVQVAYSTGFLSYPTSIDLGDFNGDSRIDIVTANRNSNNVGVFFGYTNGTFAEMAVYSTGDGSLPACVRVGDFNNDNISDIAIGQRGNNDVIVFHGLGDGGFLTAWAFSTEFGSGLWALDVDDFNKDSRLDIVVINDLTNKIDVFLGDGTDLFSLGYTFIMDSGTRPHSVAVGHFNNDDQLDIVIANYGTGSVTIALGPYNGLFLSTVTVLMSVDSAPYSVAVGDFNNDNRSDIVVTNSGTGTIAILIGYGNGTFATAVYYSTGDRSRPYTITISDLNNDNILDIAVANSGTNNIFLLYGHKNGTFGNEEWYPLGYDSRPYSLAVADLNQDGLMEIVIVCYGSNNVAILMKMC